MGIGWGPPNFQMGWGPCGVTTPSRMSVPRLNGGRIFVIFRVKCKDFPFLLVRCNKPNKVRGSIYFRNSNKRTPLYWEVESK